MRVLLTGTTGYIGRRLRDILAREPDVRLRLLVRNAAKLNLPPSSAVEIFEGSTFDAEARRRSRPQPQPAVLVGDEARQQPPAAEIESLSIGRRRDSRGQHDADFALRHDDGHVPLRCVRYSVNQVRMLQHQDGRFRSGRLCWSIFA